MKPPDCAGSLFKRASALAASLAFLTAGCGEENTEPESGTLEIVVSTTGGDLDVNGYVLLVDGRSHGPIGLLALVRLQPWPAGSHTVSLLDIDSNCELIRQPGTVTVRANETTRAEFDVVCHATAVTVHVRTEGLDLDPDGYTIQVGPFVLHTGAYGSVTAGRLAPGGYPIRVSGLAANCEALGGLFTHVQVNSRQVVEVTFDFICSAVTGVVEATVRTTGLDPDPDYLIQVGSALPVAIAANGSARVHQVPVGSHSVELTGLTPNCSIPAGENPKSVLVTAAGFKRDTSRIQFAVTCAAAEKIGFVHDNLIQVVYIDGSNSFSPGLTRGTFSWSPDGTSIVYEGIECEWQYPYYDDTCTNLGLLIANVAYGGGYALTTGPTDRDPAWSPDGSSIAFSRGGRLHVMSPPAGTALALNIPAISATEPAWRQGGDRLAFTCEIATGNQDICAVNRDGTGFVRLTSTPGPDQEPAWHPDGSRIAFTTDYNGVRSVVHMAPDGTDLVRIISGESPAWSPTGDRLVVVGLGAGLGIVNADGTGFRIIVTGPARAPAWRP